MRHIKSMIISIIGVLLLTAPTLAQVNVPIGDIPSGQQVTITYDVTVNEELPQGVRFIGNQGTVTGNGFAPVLSDDPDTPAFSDETRTSTGFSLNVVELPPTGESPFWYTLVLSLIVAAIGTAIIGTGYIAWQRR